MLMIVKYLPLFFFFLTTIMAAVLTIHGYTSTFKAYQAINSTVSVKLTDAISFAISYAGNNSGILSYTSPDVILFLQLIHSVMKDNMILTNLILDSSKKFNNSAKRKTIDSRRKEEYKRWLDTTFDFSKNDVYNFVKKITSVPTTVPPVMAEQIFLLDNKYKIIKECFMNNDVEMIHWFLDSGFQLNNILFEDVESAFKIGSVDIVKLILKHKYFQKIKGLLVSSQYIYKQTFLHIAVQVADLDEIRSLLKSGALINAIDDFGTTPIYRALETKRLDVIELLIENADLDLKYGTDENSLLHVAVEQRQPDIVYALIRKKYSLIRDSINVKNKNGDAPIHFAAKYFNQSVLQVLVNAGASVNIKNNLGETPLHIASFLGDLEAVQALIRHNANINEKDNEGAVPLMRAVNKKNIDIINEFLQINRELINIKNEMGDSVMHLAVVNSDVKFVESLLESGASANEKNKLLQTPLYISALKGDFDMVNLLKIKTNINSSNNGLNMLHEAALAGNVKAVKSLINAGIDVNSRGLWGNTALHFAAGQGHANVVSVLLQMKANVTLKNKALLTPLHVASLGGHSEVVKELVNACAERNVKDVEGRTPEVLAEKNNHKHVISFLRSRPSHCP